MKSSALIAVALLSVAAVADEVQGPRRDFGNRRQMGPGGGIAMMDPIARMVSNPKVAEKLGITEEQKAKLEALEKSQRDSMKNARGKLREAMDRQMKLMQAEKINEAEVMASVDEVFELRRSMAKEQMKRIINVKSILTPEQIKKAHEQMAAFRDRQGRPGGDVKGKMRRNAGDRGHRRNIQREGDNPKAEKPECKKDCSKKDCGK